MIVTRFSELLICCDLKDLRANMVGALRLTDANAALALSIAREDAEKVTSEKEKHFTLIPALHHFTLCSR